MDMRQTYQPGRKHLPEPHAEDSYQLPDMAKIISS